MGNAQKVLLVRSIPARPSGQRPEGLAGMLRTKKVIRRTNLDIDLITVSRLVADVDRSAHMRLVDASVNCEKAT